MLKTTFVLLMTASSAFWPFLANQPTDPSLFAVAPFEASRNPISNSTALTPFFQQLAAIESHTRRRPLRIIQYGDSHTKADLFTGAVRKNLMRDFGDNAPALVNRTAYTPRSAERQLTVYQPMGINGARAKRLRDLSDDPGFLQSLAQERPDLIVLAYGTNEVTDEDWTVTSYARMYIGIINRLRTAAPEASFIIIGPPDRAVPSSNGWSSARRMSSLLEAQQIAAATAGAAFWSEFDAMGGSGSMTDWVGRGLARFDHVHFTANGYTKLAGLFYRDLMNCYRSEAAQPQPYPLKGIDLRVMQGIPVPTRKRSN